MSCHLQRLYKLLSRKGGEKESPGFPEPPGNLLLQSNVERQS